MHLGHPLHLCSLFVASFLSAAPLCDIQRRMLTALSIQNFAIIDRLDISFDAGLTVITGETGAGKSVLINALNLVLGGRSRSEIVRTGQETAEVVALFSVEGNDVVNARLEEAGIDCDGELAIRRVVSRNGRSRIYVNGVLVNAKMLADLAEGLVDISGQHEHLSLMKSEVHLDLLDRIAGLSAERETVASCYAALCEVDRALCEMRERQKHRNEREALLRFQIQELDQAQLKDPDEEDQLSQEAVRLSSVERLREAAQVMENELYDASGSGQARLERALKSCQILADADARFLPVCEELSSALAVVEDAARTASHYARDLHASPERLDEVQSRLSLLARLRRKYGATLKEVIDHWKSLKAELEGLACAEEQLEHLERERAERGKALVSACNALTAARFKGGRQLSAAVCRELASLGMGSAVLCVEISPLTSGIEVDGRFYSARGGDKVEFLLSANRGEAPQPLNKIASGGELSRFMLSVKRVIASKDAVPTYVFDEVDTGVGGPTAEAIGRKLAAVSAYAQALCITHLPQIAALATTHLKVSKSESDGRTTSRIVQLSESERIEELARMLGGQQITQTTRAHAEEMVRLGREISASARANSEEGRAVA